MTTDARRWTAMLLLELEAAGGVLWLDQHGQLTVEDAALDAELLRLLRDDEAQLVEITVLAEKHIDAMRQMVAAL